MVLPRRAQPGGGIALQTVYQFPERVDRLILIGSGGLGSEVSLVLRAGTGAGRGLPSRCCRFINGLLILVTAARPGAGRATSSSAKTGSAIETLVERQTRLIRLLHLRGRDADSLRAAIAAALADLPPSLIRSIIWDQGIEMARHIDITALGAPVYFCDSRSPWQRGRNENANGLLRQYFPKGSSLSRYTPEHLTTVQDEINKRPRRVLGDRSPTELFTALLASQDHQLLRR